MATLLNWTAYQIMLHSSVATILWGMQETEVKAHASDSAPHHPQHGSIAFFRSLLDQPWPTLRVHVPLSLREHARPSWQVEGVSKTVRVDDGISLDCLLPSAHLAHATVDAKLLGAC